MIFILTLTFWNYSQTETRHVILLDNLTGAECIAQMESLLKLSSIGDLACEPDFVAMGERAFQ